MELTTHNVEFIFLDCLFRESEDKTLAVIVEGIINDFGFHPDRLKQHEEDIYSLLKELPDEFQRDTGSGWSFLNACNDKNGILWGQHRNIEQLVTLGIGIEKAKYSLPRQLWPALPGGMPYLVVL